MFWEIRRLQVQSRQRRAQFQALKSNFLQGKEIDKAVSALMNKSLEERKSMRDAAQKYFDENFEKSKVVDRFSELVLENRDMSCV